jgi:exonuclease VII small subunit
MEDGFTFKEGQKMSIADQLSRGVVALDRVAASSWKAETTLAAARTTLVEAEARLAELKQRQREGPPPQQQPEAKFKNGQSVHQWWATWMAGVWATTAVREAFFRGLAWSGGSSPDGVVRGQLSDRASKVRSR